MEQCAPRRGGPWTSCGRPSKRRASSYGPRGGAGRPRPQRRWASAWPARPCWKLSIGAGGCVAGVTLLWVAAVAAAFAPLWLASLVVGGLVLAVSAAVGLAGWRALPRRPLAPTAARVKTELEELRSGIRGRRS